MAKKAVERAALTADEIEISTGLTSPQVEERKQKGYVNDVKIGTSRTIKNILFDNVFTFFNVITFIIFIWMAFACETFDDWKNCTFIVVIALNTLIGVIQEIKAKRTMDKMSLLSSPEVTVLRDGEDAKIKMNEILLNEVVLLSSGSQICSDSILRQGELEVNESQLTGESLPVKKEAGDTLLSGSFVVSGRGKAEVTHIGEDNYMTGLAKEAKKFKKAKSELIKSLQLIMKVIAIIIIPIGIVAFFNNFTANLSVMYGLQGRIIDVLRAAGGLSSTQLYAAYRLAVFPTATSFIGMIPAGMFLLTSVALAVGIVRLLKRKALVQELYSIETLARVNMLCLDKTGTITDGTMKVNSVFAVKDGVSKKDVAEIVSSMQYVLTDENQTADALKQHFGAEEKRHAEYFIPFSSERKCSAVSFGDVMYVLGAPEYATDKCNQKVQALIDKYTEKGFRCLLLAEYRYKLKNQKEIPVNTTAVGVIIIEDNVKADCFETIKFFKENDVDVRVISGDNARTVSVIADRVGIPDAEKYISLKDLTDDEIRAVALDYRVFGRVSPAQKKLLIQIFKQAGNTVAMTGDGINDILAMKEADCSVAMANGSEATRNVAHVVLLDNNFASMPAIVSEGRRVVNNIERASTMFLTKTMFTFLMTVLLIFAHETFPIEPVQLSFISMFAIGIPSAIIALEPNNRRIKGKFIRNVTIKILPGAITTVIAAVTVMVLQNTGSLQMGDKEMKTLVTVVILMVFMLVLANISRPFNKYRTLMFGLVLVAEVLVVVLSPYFGQFTMGGLFKPGSLNLYKLYPVYSLVNITLVVALLYLSEKLIRLTAFAVKKADALIFKLQETRKLEKMRAIDTDREVNRAALEARFAEEERERRKQEELAAAENAEDDAAELVVSQDNVAENKPKKSWWKR